MSARLLATAILTTLLVTGMGGCSKWKQSRQVAEAARFWREIADFENMSVEGLTRVLNRTVPAGARGPYPGCFRSSDTNWQESAYGYVDWHNLMLLDLDQHAEPFRELDESEFADVFKRTCAFCSFLDKDEDAAVSWLRSSLHNPPTILDVVYASQLFGHPYSFVLRPK